MTPGSGSGPLGPAGGLGSGAGDGSGAGVCSNAGSALGFRAGLCCGELGCVAWSRSELRPASTTGELCAMGVVSS